MFIVIVSKVVGHREEVIENESQHLSAIDGQ